MSMMMAQPGVLPSSVQQGGEETAQSLEADLELQGECVVPASHPLWRKLADNAFDYVDLSMLYVSLLSKHFE